MEEILDEELNTSKTELQRSKGEKERERVREIIYYIYILYTWKPSSQNTPLSVAKATW